MIFTGSCLLMLLTIVIAILLIRHNNRLNKLHMDQDSKLHQTRQMHIEENERMMHQISKELHDNIGQMASLIRSSLHKAKRMSGEAPLSKLIDETALITDQLMFDTKNISHSLNQDFIKAGNLHLLIEQELERIRNFNGITFELNIIGQAKRLAPESKLVIYRIAQEAFHNVTKHAQAKHINVSIEYRNDSFRLTIQDDGIGFPQQQWVAEKGIGLSNMRERAARLQGEIIIDAHPGQGCTVYLVLHPVQYID